MSISSKAMRSGLIAFGLLHLLFASPRVQAAAPVDPKSVSEVDAGIGPCTADFTVTDEAGAPVYAAHVRVHIAYGWMNLHKFDLDVGTNAEGKARFIGLPEAAKQGLFFHASEGDRAGSAFDNPAKTCKAQFTVVLRKTASVE
jgi:hypothetical protein